MIEEKRILCWNFRGASRDQFLREMREVTRFYSPLMVILLDSKVSGEVADGLCNNLGMSLWSRSEAEGFSGGV